MVFLMWSCEKCYIEEICMVIIEYVFLTCTTQALSKWDGSYKPKVMKLLRTSKCAINHNNGLWVLIYNSQSRQNCLNHNFFIF